VSPEVWLLVRCALATLAVLLIGFAWFMWQGRRAINDPGNRHENWEDER